MRLIIGQNQIGKFNLFGGEETLAFNIKITEDNSFKSINGGKTEEKYPKDINAALDLGTNENIQYNQNILEEMFDNFDISGLIDFHEEVNRYRFSTGCNYDKDREFFIETLRENFDEIFNNFKKERERKLRENIKHLKDKLNCKYSIESLEEFNELY